MTTAMQNRQNRMYSHQTSVEARAAERAPPEMSPIGEIRKRHNDERARQGLTFKRETDEMNDRHATERSSDRQTMNGAQPADLTLYREREERDELDRRHESDRRRLASMHSGEMEAAFLKHGVAQ